MRESATAVGANRWAAWPVFWTPVLVGALAAIVAVALFGVIGTAIGASKAGAAGRITTFSGIGLGALAYAVFASFLAFVIGGWITARVGGITWAEPAMLHGAIASSSRPSGSSRWRAWAGPSTAGGTPRSRLLRPSPRRLASRSTRMPPKPQRRERPPPQPPSFSDSRGASSVAGWAQASR